MQVVGRALLACLVSLWAASSAWAVECVTPRSWVPRVEASPLDANGNFVDDEIDAMTPTDVISVVVSLNRCPVGLDLERLAQYGTLGNVGRWLSYVVLRDLPARTAVRLAARESIVAFVENLGTDEGGLDVSNPAVRVRTSTDYTPNTVDDRYPGSRGAGVNIAIVDTGVDDTLHESFGSTTFVAGADCLSDPCQAVNPDDDNGHGTAVAGIALGQGGLSGTYQGIARQSGLIDVKVLDASNSAVGDSVLRGLNWLLDRQAAVGDVDVVNLSLARSARSNGTDVRSQLLNRLVNLGSVVVTIAGNCFQFNQPPRCSYVPEYGAADLAITVGNSEPRGTILRTDDRISNDSMRGPRGSDFDMDTTDEQKPDLAAPGTDVTTAAFNTQNGYVTVTPGTSFAAPHVAGCAAILLQQNPAMTPSSVKQVLLDTAEQIGGASTWDEAWGNGLLDCFAAVELVSSGVKTDMGFGGYPCVTTPPGPICWLNPDLVPQNPAIQEGVPNAMLVTVRNFGFQTSAPARVRVGVYAFSNGQEGYDQCVLDVPALTPGQATVPPLSCPWTPRALAPNPPDPQNPNAPQPPTVHACLKADIVYPLDRDFSNNFGQHNIDIARTHSAVSFPAQVFNTTQSMVRVEIDGQCSNGECQGWSYGPEDNGFDLPPEACPRTLDFIMEPVAPNAPRAIQIDWAIRGVTPQGDPLTLGGFSTAAVIGCGTKKLAFEEDGLAPPKSRLTWSPDLSFTACPPLFDVARGPLPIPAFAGPPARGDFSAAVCIADDVAATEFIDTEEPNPGEGFYYMTRAGGPLAGTFDESATSQVGSRDDTFKGCP